MKIFNKWMAASFVSACLAVSALGIFSLIPERSEAVTDQMDLFDPFELEVHQKLVDIEDDTFKVVLSNTAPAITSDGLSDVTQISAGTGYTTGGATVAVDSLSQTSGVMTWVLGTDVLWTATGTMGPLRYATIYDDTSTGDLLVGILDFGSSITLESGDTFSIPFDGVTMLTVTQN